MPVFSVGVGRLGICIDCARSAVAWFGSSAKLQLAGKLKRCLYCRTKGFKKVVVYDEGGEALQGICVDCARTAVRELEAYERRKIEEAKPKQLALPFG